MAHWVRRFASAFAVRQFLDGLATVAWLRASRLLARDGGDGGLFRPTTMVSFFCMVALSADGWAADRIVLRDLTVISDQTVQSMDVDGVVLSRGMRLRWDEIESGSLSANQGDFDRLLREVGGPLYRIRQRLKVGDYPGASEFAESLYPQFATRSSESAYLVLHAAMWSRIVAGRRELAVAPWLRCYAMLLQDPEYANRLPIGRRVAVDLATGICADLLPVWWNTELAREALPDVREAAQSIPEPRPDGVRLYAGTLALSAGDVDWGRRVLESMNQQHGSAKSLQALGRAILLLHDEKPSDAVQRLRMEKNWPESLRPLVWYWVGTAELAASDPREKRQGVLDLLRLPALYASTQPEICGASLFQASEVLESLDDLRGSIVLRKELTSRFADTTFAKRLLAERNESPTTK